MDDPQASRVIRVTNSGVVPLRVVAEPFGFDFPVATGKWVELVAGGVGPSFSFEVKYGSYREFWPDEGRVGVWPSGSFSTLIVRNESGDLARF